MADEPEWPEFRQWYALMLEEERLFKRPDAPDTDDPRHVEISRQMRPLDEAMHTRRPRSPVNRAILAVLALYWCDKANVGPHQRRLLLLGCNQDLEAECFGNRQQAHLIDANVREAVEKNLLPGVVIYGDGGNA
jgi:hypothetical protein